MSATPIETRSVSFEVAHFADIRSPTPTIHDESSKPEASARDLISWSDVTGKSSLVYTSGYDLPKSATSKSVSEGPFASAPHGSPPGALRLLDVADLLAIAAACDALGIEIRAKREGGLRVRAPHDAPERLTPERLARLRQHKPGLLAMLLGDDRHAAGHYRMEATEPVELAPGLLSEAQALPTKTCDAPATPTKVVCRCGSTTWRDEPIHRGHSVRRDCAACGRFIDFSLWYGKDNLRNEH